MPSSYNGWPASPNGADIGVDTGFRAASAQGAIIFPGGVKAGDVSTVLGFVAVQFFATVEAPVFGPVYSGKPNTYGYGCWGYNYRANANNPNNLSNHSSGTAIDINATLHPNGARGTFTSKQVTAIRAILSACQNAVEWGGDFTGTPDEMHFDIKVSASTLARVAASLPAGGTPEPEPEPDKESTDMALVITASDAARPHLFLQGSTGIQLSDGASTAALQDAGVPFAAIKAADWDRIRTKYEVDPVEATIV